MSEPRLSVIITTFNRPRLVQEAIESVLSQDVGPPFEIVVVDDGSTGDTRDALQRFGRTIRYARQDNLGLNPARNHGLRIVEGDLVAILDDDDIWLPFKTRTLLPALARYPEAGFVHSNFYVWKPERDERHSDGLHTWFPKPFTWPELYRERTDVAVPAAPGGADAEGGVGLDRGARTVEAWLGDLYYWSLFSPMVLPSTAIIRRSALGRDTWFYDENQVGDWEFFARLSHRCGGVFVPVETTLNRSHDDAFRLTRAGATIRVLRRIGLIRRVWRSDPDFIREHRDELDRVEAGCLRQLAKASIIAGDYTTAREAMQTVGGLPGQGLTSDTLLRAAAIVPGTASAIGALRWLRGRLPARKRARGF
jgi:glycosyltransferase involved in cell wall biosynthesis